MFSEYFCFLWDDLARKANSVGDIDGPLYRRSERISNVPVMQERRRSARGRRDAKASVVEVKFR